MKISLRLWILTGIMLVLMIVMGILGLSGMKASQTALEELYNDPMAHTRSMGKILSSFQNIQSQLALAIQHAPDSKVLDLHNHAVDKHLNFINEDIQAIEKHIETVIMIP